MSDEQVRKRKMSWKKGKEISRGLLVKFLQRFLMFVATLEGCITLEEDLSNNVFRTQLKSPPIINE